MSSNRCFEVECPEDAILQTDLEEILKEDIPFDKFDEKVVLITGATGLIGSQLVKLLACISRKRNINIHVLAMVRDYEKAQRILRNILHRDNIQLVYGDILRKISYEGHVDYIIHTASVTSSQFFVKYPVETIDIAINGTKNVLEFAKEKNVQSIVYVSSLEIYGVPTVNIPIDETAYGYIDPLQVRSSYSEGKRLAECLCCSYAAEYNVPAKIARLSQTFGAGVEYNDTRVFAEFARCVIEHRDIVLHTRGNTVRTYCYTRDALIALLIILFKGNIGEAYNVANENTKISIKDMATLVCSLSKENIKVQFDCPSDLSMYGYNPEMIIALDCTKLKKIGWSPTINLKEMFNRLIGSMALKRA